MAEEFWKTTFRGFEGFEYPKLPDRNYSSISHETQDHELCAGVGNPKPDDGGLLWARLQASWGILLSLYANSDDVVFGTSLGGVDRSFGPMSGSAIPESPANSSRTKVLPLRIQLNWQSSINDLLQSVHDRTMCMKAVEDWGGLPQIAGCSSEAKEGSLFRTLVVSRHMPKTPEQQGSHGIWIDYVIPSGNLSLMLECFPAIHSKGVFLRLHFDRNIFDPGQAKRMLYQFEHLFKQTHAVDHPSSTIQENFQCCRLVDLDTSCEHDKEIIWKWNSKSPRPIQCRIQDLFAQQVMLRPQSQAVDAWDGTLTYAELDDKSTALAAYLLDENVAGRGRVVPVCFDKTIWTTITILALAKIGSIFVLLDPHQPQGRLSTVLAQLNAEVILIRDDTESVARALGKSVVRIDDMVLVGYEQGKARWRDAFAAVTPDDLLYFVFTSGSTGTPKGCMISHQNLCSGATHQARVLGFAHSRTFDSSSYSFDAYVCNTFHTLVSGGCLCVPSEKDRMNNLEGVLRDMDVNFVQLTPSVSRLLDPRKLPSIRTLILTGEKINRDALNLWLTTGTTVINAYGPSECTIMCAANTKITCIQDAESIGFGLGANLWIADIHNINKLAPVGAVGELLIDGPIVGQGYLADEAKTKESLVTVPRGYLAGVAADTPKLPIFRTRDLARYNSDGSITFISRGDTQIKINGQRVEIGEVEHHLQRCLPQDMYPVVEAIQWPSGAKQLIAFLCPSEAEACSLKNGRVSTHQAWQDRVKVLIKGMGARLEQNLPRYMIPSAYFPTLSMPMTASGKTDRKCLRQMALEAPDLLLDESAAAQDRHRQENDVGQWPMSASGVLVQRLFAEILGKGHDSIKGTDNFFHLGGDSLSAMHFVRAAKREGFAGLTVADIFKRPCATQLEALIEKNRLSNVPHGQFEAMEISKLSESFSLATAGLHRRVDSVEQLLEEVAGICQCDTTDIEDIYPCSPIQEELMVLSTRRPMDFVTQTVMKLPHDLSIPRLQAAWNSVLSDVQILRTRIVYLDIMGHTGGFRQVVMRAASDWSRYTHLEACLQHEKVHDIGGLGQPLFRLALTKTSEQRDTVVLSMHHCVYDGWSLDLILSRLRAHYYSDPAQLGASSLSPYKAFIQWIQESPKDESYNFWKDFLHDFQLRDYPALPSADYRPVATSLYERHITGLDWKGSNSVTPSTIVQTAWGIALSKHSGLSDIVYGATLLGRQIPLSEADRIGGPTIATVPIRIQMDWESQTVPRLLRHVQEQLASMMPFVHYGIDNIKKIDLATREACKFKTFLVVQPMIPESEVRGPEFSLGNGRDDIAAFNTYSIMVEASLEKNGLLLRASFDEGVISKPLVIAMLVDMEKIVRHFCESQDDRALIDTDLATTDELRRIAASRSQGIRTAFRETEYQLRRYLAPLPIWNLSIEPSQPPKPSQHVRELTAIIYLHEGVLSMSLPDVQGLITSAHERISSSLPLNSVPTLYRLIQGSAVVLDLMDSDLEPADVPPASLTESEAVLKILWSQVLGNVSHSIGKHTSFLSAGGDSLSAMKLVAAARARGYNLTVGEILQRPLLQDQAAVLNLGAIRSQHDQGPLVMSQETVIPAPFSLLDDSVAPGVDVRDLAAECGVDPRDIEDAYPCSPLQKAMMAATARRHGAYVSRSRLRLPPNLDVNRLRAAWEHVIRVNPILRTRIVECNRGFMQVVIKGNIAWTIVDGVEDDQAAPFGFGTPLLHFNLVHTSEANSTPLLIMSIHHAIHDRWSAQLILKAVRVAYNSGQVEKDVLPYSVFIRYLCGKLDDAVSAAYWGKYLSGFDAPQFPTLPALSREPVAECLLKSEVRHLRWPKVCTPSNALRAAFALLISQYTNSDEVGFGSTVMGRQIPLKGIEMIAGPTIATVPIRVMIDWKGSLATLLAAVQDDSTAMIQHEHFGLEKIGGLSPEAGRACHFQSLLVIQAPEGAETRDTPVFALQLGDDDIEGINSYALSVECTLQDSEVHGLGGVDIVLNYDRSVIGDVQAQRMLEQYKCIVQQFCGEDSAQEGPLECLNIVPQSDLRQIWSWNAAVPDPVDVNFHDFVKDRFSARPDAPAICSWDGERTYGALYLQALALARWLVCHHGVGPGTFVPLCFAKSVFAPIAMLGVIISGGAVVMIDPSQPSERLEAIGHQLSAKLVLTHPSTASTAETLVPSESGVVETVDEAFIERVVSASRSGSMAAQMLPQVSGDDALYVTFTSGSTGTPKGVVITHGNCCSGIIHQGSILGFNSGTRALDASSYSFDVVWETFMQVLYAGGCICIPSDTDRLVNIAKAIRDMNVNFLDITPSLSRLIDPAAVPSVNTVVFGGEPLNNNDVTRWRYGTALKNSYGPSECTITSTISLYERDFDDKINIGRPYGLNAWVESCLQPGRLAPVGAIGELLLEGPLVGKGYLKNPEETARSFVSGPQWLLAGDACSGHAGRQGRLYRTGDLVRYNSQGLLEFCGRKDTQIKVHGQRVELEEIEAHAQQLVGSLYAVAAEVVEVPIGPQSSAQSLIMFIAELLVRKESAIEDDSAKSCLPTDQLNLDEELVKGLAHDLGQRLPRYMVPSSYVGIQTIPLMPSGKVDRKRLRAIAITFKKNAMMAKKVVVEPATIWEQVLRQAWASVLGVSEDNISRDDNFFELGGDSMAAIQLVGLARQHDMPLTVAAIFQFSQLNHMAAQFDTSRPSSAAVSRPESLSLESGSTPGDSLSSEETDLDTIRRKACSFLGLPDSDVVEVLPLTSFQSYAARCNFSEPRTEWNFFSTSMPRVPSARIEKACRDLVRFTEIFRTVLCIGEGSTLVQVVLKDLDVPITIKQVSECDTEEARLTCCRHELEKDFGLGAPMVSFSILTSAAGQAMELVMGISHLLYDGISLGLVSECLRALIEHRPLPTDTVDFSKYIHCTIGNSMSSESHEYWTLLLRYSPVPNKLGPHQALQGIKPAGTVRHHVLKQVQVSPLMVSKSFTVASVFCAAWGASLSTFTENTEIVFGRAVSGRAMASASLKHPEKVIGPCLNLIPVRGRFRADETAVNIVQSLHQQLVESIPHETTRFVDIVGKCTEWAEGTEFGAVFYFQNFEAQPGTIRGGNNNVGIDFAGISVDGRPEDPEPPRLNVWPEGPGSFALELLMPNHVCTHEETLRLLDGVTDFLHKMTLEVTNGKQSD